ncbi:hypothetical protein [Streptomyces sp. NPDC050704]|uniref:hypothetical protein n=1 Tax=Streptomyces sp. NPDC050704 TaxID=3157219 RepID=UPI003430704B
MTDLHLIISRPAPGHWHARLDVAEALEAAGWTGDAPTLLGKDGAFWGVTSVDDDSKLTCPNDTVIEFPAGTPTVVVVAACLAAADQPV